MEFGITPFTAFHGSPCYPSDARATRLPILKAQPFHCNSRLHPNYFVRSASISQRHNCLPLSLASQMMNSGSGNKNGASRKLIGLKLPIGISWYVLTSALFVNRRWRAPVRLKFLRVECIIRVGRWLKQSRHSTRSAVGSGDLVMSAYTNVTPVPLKRSIFFRIRDFTMSTPI